MLAGETLLLGASLSKSKYCWALLSAGGAEECPTKRRGPILARCVRNGQVDGGTGSTATGGIGEVVDAAIIDQLIRGIVDANLVARTSRNGWQDHIVVAHIAVHWCVDPGTVLVILNTVDAIGQVGD